MSDDVMTIEEHYTSATHSSNLRVQADCRGDADVMISAGWSHSRVGMALLRLHSEYDGVQHPRKMHQSAIEAYALTLPGTPAQRLYQARADANRWHQHELALMLGRIKSLPAVREQLTIKAHHLGMESPRDVAAAVLLWWLDKVCHMCHGQKREVIANTPILSDIVCPVCHGEGERKLPYGENGRKLANFMDDCIYRARQSLKNRLHYR